MANPSSLKPFTKNDPRINRDGRPKDSIGLAALARRISHEKATRKDGTPLLGPDGKPMTVVEAILRQMANDPKRQDAFLNRAYGALSQEIDLRVTRSAEDLSDDELATIATSEAGSGE